MKGAVSYIVRSPTRFRLYAAKYVNFDRYLIEITWILRLVERLLSRDRNLEKWRCGRH